MPIMEVVSEGSENEKLQDVPLAFIPLCAIQDGFVDLSVFIHRKDRLKPLSWALLRLCLLEIMRTAQVFSEFG